MYVLVLMCMHSIVMERTNSCNTYSCLKTYTTHIHTSFKLSGMLVFVGDRRLRKWKMENVATSVSSNGYYHMVEKY